MKQINKLSKQTLLAMTMTTATFFSHAGSTPPDDGKSMRAGGKTKTTYICQMGNHSHMAGMGSEQEYDKPGICPTDGMEMIAKNSRLTVAVLVYEGVQDIDYSGPMEVFGQAGAKIFTVAANTESVHSTYGIKMQPDFDLDHAPEADVLLIPGGNVNAIINNPKALAWVRQRSGDVKTVLSVCTGAFILGKAGLLDGLSATTIAGAIPQLEKMEPKAHIVANRRYVDNGKFITTAGLSAGMDGALHVVDREIGRLRAQDVARGIEYEWHPGGKGSFALLAAYQMPDVSILLPEGTPWERTVERGDTRQWEVRGRVEIANSAKDFLDASGMAIKTEKWTPVSDKDQSHRHFIKNKDGISWELDLSLANDNAPSAYQLRLVVKVASADKKKLARM
ncbi:DJ-1/PfpI family protein [Undibacterium sp. Ren11W]|uniref:DJ-1/PfpI family protein n=1 Tax=Undibacterium sp. Ren11W TaxID=3413045 RepID=UPI003BF18C15